MMKFAQRVGCFCLLALLCVPVFGADESETYHIGEVARENIVAPVALDVVDPVATAALKSDEALKTPVIFRTLPGATNALAQKFLTIFANTRSNFMAAVRGTFQHAPISEEDIASPDFGYLITAFNIRNRDFPLTTSLAADWARGNAGVTERKWLLGLLLQARQLRVRPDDLPKGFVMSESVRLVPVSSPDEKITLQDAEKSGQLIAETNLITLSHLQILFRSAFTADDEQPLAYVLSMWLKPNCLPDATLTQLARDHAVGQLVVADHYNAGQIIVRRGTVINAKILAALDQLNDNSSPDTASRQIVAKPAQTLSRPTPVLPVVSTAALQNQEQSATPKPAGQIVSTHHSSSQTPVPSSWLIPLYAAIFTALLLTIVLLVLLFRRWRSSLSSARPVDSVESNSVVLQSELAPHLTQAIKDALVQELAMQRRELVLAQQSAAIEIAELVRRLDELQMPMQERLRAYETQIQKLEKELAERTAENRELIKLKIEMTRRQFELERARTQTQFN